MHRSYRMLHGWVYFKESLSCVWRCVCACGGVCIFGSGKPGLSSQAEEATWRPDVSTGAGDLPGACTFLWEDVAESEGSRSCGGSLKLLWLVPVGSLLRQAAELSVGSLGLKPAILSGLNS